MADFRKTCFTDRNRSEQLAARSVLPLNRALIAGFFRNEDRVGLLLNDFNTDLDSLRSRPDFQLLMMDLAMPADPFARDQ